MEEHDYSIVVMMKNSHFPDDQSLSQFPQVSITWDISKTYHVLEHPRSSIQDPNTLHKFGPINSLPSPDIISHMLHEIYIPFQLDNLRWKAGTESNPLSGVDDMIGNIRGAISEMLVKEMRKQLKVIVKVEKQIGITQQEYNAMAARREMKETLKDFCSMLSRSGLQRHAARDQALTRADVVNRRSAVSSWNRIRSRAAELGLLDINSTNIHHDINSYGGDYGREMNQMLVELGTMIELLSGDGRKPVVKAASKAWIEGLEKFMKIDGVDYGSNSEYCVVCMEKMESGVLEVSCLPCSHMFHAKCIVQWLKMGHTCPVCRFEVPTD